MATPTALRTSTPTLGVTPFGPGLFAVASSSPAHGPYRVEQHGVAWRCDCPAHRYSKADPQTCKHVAAARAFVAAEQEERQPAAAPRWCALCLLSPVTDGLAVCPTCASAEATRAVTAIDEYYAAGATRTMAASDEDDAAEPSALAWDLGAEYARVAATNARVDALLGWED